MGAEDSHERGAENNLSEIEKLKEISLRREQAHRSRLLGLFEAVTLYETLFFSQS
jgi:hypothetical protein